MYLRLLAEKSKQNEDAHMRFQNVMRRMKNKVTRDVFRPTDKATAAASFSTCLRRKTFLLAIETLRRLRFSN